MGRSAKTSTFEACFGAQKCHFLRHVLTRSAKMSIFGQGLDAKRRKMSLFQAYFRANAKMSLFGLWARTAKKCHFLRHVLARNVKMSFFRVCFGTGRKNYIFLKDSRSKEPRIILGRFKITVFFSEELFT